MKRHALLLCGAAAIALATAGIAEAAEAASFNIPAQPLSTALAQFGVQSQHGVFADSALTSTKTTQGVSGDKDAEIALNELLAGTGLSWRRDGSSFIIMRASDPQSGSAAGDGADGTVQALVVTAQKREENIQDVPIAMSAFTQEDLTRSQVAGGPDLMTQVPNFTFTKTNFSGYSIQIRGIGTQAISATTDPAVAVAFNNTPFVRNRFFEQEFYDLERVEVLRGPQGTLYGRNATAGVVNILSAEPKNHYEARLSGDVSNYNSSRLEGMLNIPLVEDKVALRIAGAWTKRDGYVKNILAGEQTDGRDLWSSRITLGLTPTDALRVNLIWEHFDENDDRLRSGKQLCHSDPGPSEINGVPIGQSAASITGTPTVGYVSQGCLAASLYSKDSFDTPNGYALPYYGPLGAIGLPVYISENPYVSTFQSQNLRDIETHLKPEYRAKSPRLFGLRVTKNWSGDAGWIAMPHTPGAPYLLTIEAGAQGARLDAPAQGIQPFPGGFNGALDPVAPQVEDLDWSHRGELRATYRPQGTPWTLSAGVRYGKVLNQTGVRRQEEVTGPPVCKFSYDSPNPLLVARAHELCDPNYVLMSYGQEVDFFDPGGLLTPTNRLKTSTNRLEEHRVVEFAVGRDVGLGGILSDSQSILSLGLRYGEFKSLVDGEMRGVPDLKLPDAAWVKYTTTFHQYADTFDAERTFKGAGPVVSLDTSKRVFGGDAAHLNVDLTLAGGTLFGKQKARISGTQGDEYFSGKYPFDTSQQLATGWPPPVQTPMNIQPRTTTATVPVLNLSLGLSWETGGVKLSTGYRWERYFNVLDGGFTEHKAYDRTIDGPYVKFRLGFGG